MLPSSTNLRDRTITWLQQNPLAWELFQEFALDKAMQGKRFGIGQLAERVRWEAPLSTVGDEYKINNNYRAYIARFLLEKYPVLKNFLTVRKTKW